MDNCALKEESSLPLPSALSVKYSPDGAYLAAAGDTKRIKVYEVEADFKVRLFQAFYFVCI